MPYPRVLCLGEILFDRLADQVGRSLAEVESWTSYPGGAPANVACGLVKLGTSAGFIGCVGEDEPGNTLIKMLDDLGVDRTGVQRHPQAKTRQVYVLRSETGVPTFAGFGDTPTTEFADTYLQHQTLPVKLFQEADFLVIGTLELAYPLSQAAIAQAVHLAQLHYVKILVDVNWRPMFWPVPALATQLIQLLLKQVDFLKLSDSEADWLFGTTDPGAIAHRVGDLEGVIVTAGDRGCAYCLGETEGKMPAFAVKAVDTTGAGDSFVAGFIHQLCQQGIANFDQAEIAKNIITYASAVAALTSTKPGAIASQPTGDEVAVFLAENSIR